MTDNAEMNRRLRRQPPSEPGALADVDDVDDEDEADMNDLLDQRTDMAARRRAQHRRLFGDPNHNPAA